MNHEAHQRFAQGIEALMQEKLDEAEYHFVNLVADYPNAIEAIVNLGVIALKRNQGQDAITYFTKALCLNSKHIFARHNIAATFIHYDRFENALVHYRLLLEQTPNDVECLYHIGICEMALGHPEEARAYFERVLKENPEHIAALTNIAAIYHRLEARTKAYAYLEKAIAIAPEDANIQHMLDAFGGGKIEAPTRPRYALHLFNNYASFYEGHMQNTLHYAIPSYLQERIDTLPQFEHVLDLGCGTGLIGMVIAPLAKHMTGVDIAPKMLEEARKKNIYQELIVSDISDFLTKMDIDSSPSQRTSFQTYKKCQDQGALCASSGVDWGVNAQRSKQCNADIDVLRKSPIYDCIIAMDVFPYIGDLESIFHSMMQKVQPKGYILYSTEINDLGTWKLETTGRFSHAPDYIQKLADSYGFQITEQQKIVGRLHHEKPVYLMIYTAIKKP